MKRGIGRRHSLRTRLFMLVGLCILPAALGAIEFIRQDFLERRVRTTESTALLARKVMADLDRELAGIETGLKVLATSRGLQNGDLAAFHREAQAAVEPMGVLNVVLLDTELRQLLNTHTPLGAALPERGNPPQLAGVLTHGETVLTDVFLSERTGLYMVALGVPVQRAGTIVAVLASGMTTEPFQRLLNDQYFPNGWTVTILDSRGVIVSRSHTPEPFIGTMAQRHLLDFIRSGRQGSLDTRTNDGTPVIASIVQSPLYGWTVAVGAPKSLMMNDVLNSAFWIVGTIVLAFVLGLFFALRLTRGILCSIRHLDMAARSLLAGRPIELPAIPFREVESIGEALLEAERVLISIRHRADHDGLTGLANRRCFDERLRAEWPHAQRHHQPLALLMIDIDHFKAYNDRLGHLAGDVCLKRIAATLQTHMRRPYDIVARYGGEEFVCLLPECDLGGALERAESMRAAVEELAIPHPDPGTAGIVTLSIGVTVINASPSNTPEAALRMADQFLYRAKHAGRNQVRGGWFVDADSA